MESKTVLILQCRCLELNSQMWGHWFDVREYLQEDLHGAVRDMMDTNNAVEHRLVVCRKVYLSMVNVSDVEGLFLEEETDGTT